MADAMNISATDHHIPDHFAFVEISTKNFRAGDRLPDFRFHKAEDPDGEDRLIFLLQSEEISLETQPTNPKRTQNVLRPKTLEDPVIDRAHTESSEGHSTFYELKMLDACPKCGPIDNDYFDISHTDLVVLRMDLRGGRESTDSDTTKFKKSWSFKGSVLEKEPQPLAQIAVFEFDLPAAVERLVLTRGDDKTVTHIDLFSPDGKAINVGLGNEPLRDILLIDTRIPQPETSFHNHFPLIYQMYTTIPRNPPLPELVKTSGQVRGPGDDCIPPKPAPQDPAS